MENPRLCNVIKYSIWIIFFNFPSRQKTEQITPSVFVIGALEHVWDITSAFQRDEVIASRRAAGSWGRVWCFKRCQINGSVYHSSCYKRVTARNNFTFALAPANCNSLRYGSILSYAKIEEQCYQASCTRKSDCRCQLHCSHFALIQILEVMDQISQLSTVQGRAVSQNIVRARKTKNVVAVPVESIVEKCLEVSVSSGLFLCHLANTVEGDGKTFAFYYYLFSI